MSSPGRHFRISESRKIGFDFAYEAPLLAPVPEEEFDVGLTLTPRVDKTSRVPVRQNEYSVPAAVLELTGARFDVIALR
ncbi:hypothetical protein [Kitasatospora sp. NPDC005748]|uniref:Mu transposase domain-containing protein n=1 Tax=Kitasatospora sp. NPDC005748 TaxID=3157063 RepID=UPI0033F8A842